MPRGPSHSRSGGGGGFSSRGGSGGGGFSFGGFSSRRSSSGSYNGGSYHDRPRRPRGPRSFHWFGRTVVVSTGAQSLFSTLISILVIAIVACVVFGGTVTNSNLQAKEAKEAIEIYESDADWYAETIAGAEKNIDGDEYYLATATFNDVLIEYYNPDSNQTGYCEYMYFNGYDYYYIIYSYYNEVKGETMRGETYAMFTSTEVDALGGSFSVAYRQDKGKFYSVPVFYELEDNAEYLEAKQYYENKVDAKNNAIIILLIPIAVIALIVAILVWRFVVMVKKSKKDSELEQAKAEAEVAQAKAKAEIAEELAKNTNRTCAYCGAKVPDGDDCCPACGSRVYKE